MPIIKAFTREQAARIAKISPRRASYWARKGILVPSILYDLTVYPHRYLYSFVDVVGLRTLGLLRDQYSLSLQQLRKADEFLRQQKSLDRPWSELRFWVRGKELFFRDPNWSGIESASRQHQSAMPIELSRVVREVERDSKAVIKREKDDFGKTERRRNVQHNRVVVKGTRVPVESVISLLEDGYDSGQIVEAFPSLTLEDVEVIKRDSPLTPVA